MTVNLEAARAIPLTALMLAACVSERAYEQQTRQLQAAQAQASGEFGAEKLRKLHIVSVLAIALTACGSPTSLNILAYDACIARHPQESAICEGPRQAYQLDPTAVQARAPAIGLPNHTSWEVTQ
jgi:hypothetical protein